MAHFKIAAAQIPSIRGDVARNVATHAAAISVAARQHVSLLVFPELSLTGYELDLAAGLAFQPSDERLEPLIDLAARHDLTVVIGAPLGDGAAKPKLGAIVIGSNGVSRPYQKMHLGGTEPSYFTPGDEPLLLSIGGYKVGLAVCADASRPTHPAAYADAGARVYAAGVFLTAEWYRTDAPRLASHARTYGMLTLMANQAASVGSHLSVGRSAIWDPQGTLLVEAAGTEDVLLTACHIDGQWQGEAVAL